MRNFSHEGRTCTFIAPYDVKSGDGFQVGSIFAVANTDALAGSEVEGDLVGVFNLKKATSASSGGAGGIKLYWDNTNKVVTKTATSNLFIAHLLKDAADADPTFHLRVHGASA